MHFLMVADDVDSIDFPSATIAQCLKIRKLSHLQFSYHDFLAFGTNQNLLEPRPFLTFWKIWNNLGFFGTF